MKRVSITRHMITRCLNEQDMFALSSPNKAQAPPCERGSGEREVFGSKNIQKKHPKVLFLSYRKLRNYSPAVLHNRAYKKALIGVRMVQACLLFSHRKLRNIDPAVLLCEKSIG